MCGAAIDVPDCGSKPLLGTVEIMATPGAVTPISGPKHVKAGEKVPSVAIKPGRRVWASQESGGNSPILPRAETASTLGEDAGYCTAPPELPAATTHATPFRNASSSFCSTASD